MPSHPALAIIVGLLASIITGGSTWFALRAGNRKTNADADQAIANAAKSTVELIHDQLKSVYADLEKVKAELQRERTIREGLERRMQSEIEARSDLEGLLISERHRCDSLSAKVQALEVELATFRSTSGG